MYWYHTNDFINCLKFHKSFRKVNIYLRSAILFIFFRKCILLLELWRRIYDAFQNILFTYTSKTDCYVHRQQKIQCSVEWIQLFVLHAHSTFLCIDVLFIKLITSYEHISFTKIFWRCYMLCHKVDIVHSKKTFMENTTVFMYTWCTEIGRVG